jgi:aspartate/methionine/tyrosine aminotransferase
MAAILRPGDEVLIEQPVYELLLNTAYYLGAIVKRFSRRFEDGFQINTSEIKDLITPKTKLIIMTNLHNPSSVLTNESTLKEIAEITQGKCYVLVDEVYLETMFEQTPKSAFHLGENFISTNSLTKTYGLSGLRCGWILANKELAEKIWLLNDLFGVAAPHPAERLSVIALAELDKVGQRTKNLLTTNRKIINEFLDNQPKLSCVKVDFGTVVFPRLLKGNVSDLCQVLREKYETTVVPGDFFEMPNHFRLGICMNTSILIEGLERLSQALTEI